MAEAGSEEMEAGVVATCVGAKGAEEMEEAGRRRERLCISRDGAEKNGYSATKSEYGKYATPCNLHHPVCSSHLVLMNATRR